MAQNFSPADIKLVCAIIQNLKGPVNVDRDSVAITGTYANAGSAQRLYNLFKQKQGLSSNTPPKKRNMDADNNGGSEGGAIGSPTPTKRVRKAAKGAKGKMATVAAGELDDEEPAIKAEPSADE